MLQVVLVYAVNAVMKLRTDVWLGGQAVRYAFSLEQFTVLLGEVLPEYPRALVALGTVWLALVVASPLLLLLRGRARGVLAGAFVGMHAGMALSMHIGLFPLISIAALLPFLPRGVWGRVASGPGNRVSSVVEGARASRIASRVEGLRPIGPRAGLSGVFDEARRDRLRRGGRRARTVLLVVLVVTTLAWNAASLGLVAFPDVGGVDPADNRWAMFSRPPESDGWYVAAGSPAGGAADDRVDLFGAAADRWEDPRDVSATYPSARWRKYLADVRWTDDDELQHRFATWLCHRYETRHGHELRNVAVAYVSQPTRFQGPEPVERTAVVQQTCPR